MSPPEPARRRRIRPDTYLFFLALFAFMAFLTHAPLLRLPYYWDELGQFVPGQRRGETYDGTDDACERREADALIESSEMKKTHYPHV